MSTNTTNRAKPPSVLSLGVSGFAGIMLVTLGILHVLSGLSAIADDKVFVRGIDYIYEFDVTTWGWILLLTGAVAILTGAGILANQSWAYILGIVIAVASVIENFVFMPQYPLWALAVIAFDILVIWALTTRIMADRP
jgi:hypothetical protein